MARTPLSFTKKDFAISFKRKFPDADVSNAVIFEIMNAGGKAISEALLEDGDFKMGHRVGELSIRKYKPKGKGASCIQLGVDKVKSKLLQTRVFQFNDHSDGWVFRILWNKAKCKNVQDKNMWLFKPIRSLKRALATKILKEKADYPIGLKAFMNPIASK
jgi:hypothetical protein